MAGNVADNPAPVKAGKLGDVEVAGKLSIMRGVDLSPRYFLYVFNITNFIQNVPKGARSYTLWAVDSRKTRDNKVIPSPSIVVDGKDVKYEIGAKIESTVIDSWVDQLGKRQITTQE